MDGILISAIQIQVGVFYFRVLLFSILKVEGFDFGAWVEWNPKINQLFEIVLLPFIWLSVRSWLKWVYG